MPSKRSILFFVGFLGFVVSFFSWILGLFANFLALITASPGKSDFTVLIEWFFLNNQLFYTSFLLAAFGFFALKKYYGSNVSLVCGIFSILVFVANDPLFIWILYFRPSNLVSFLLYPNFILLYSEIILWGVTFLSLRTKGENTEDSKQIRGKRKAGILFVIAGTIAFLLSPFFLFNSSIYAEYDLITVWYTLGGWFYAAGAAFASLIMLRLLRVSSARKR